MESIAVVGFALRFPGEASNSKEFDRFLRSKKCAVSHPPAGRMNYEGWYHPDTTRKGTVPSRMASYIDEDVALFDAPFFSISDVEAAAMDPQQRHLLEITYRALENAGVTLQQAAGSRTSVHVGCFSRDYIQLRFKDVPTLADYDVYSFATAMNANRLSWFFDFKGASVNVDTACSSSLVALDMACQGLLAGDAEMAVVAGVNLLLSHDTTITLSNVNMLSPDGTSFSFDQRANGYGRGEGTAVLILKRTEAAIRDNDTIRAVIRSTSTNQDGRTSSGIMQPSGKAHEELILQAYQKANLDLSTTRYVEAHGTGTPIGDPIECSAIGNVFRSSRTIDSPLYVGSVKANIGHLEGASGVAGVIKAILSVESGQIFPNPNLRSINPRIDTEFLKIKFPTAMIPWPCHGTRRASVNSFGFGGANAHVVLDGAKDFLELQNLQGHYCEYTKETLIPGSSNQISKSLHEHGSNQQYLVTLTGHSRKALSTLIELYQEHFAGLPEPRITQEYLQSLSYTLNHRRTKFEYRSFLKLSSAASLKDVSKLASRIIHSVEDPRLAFIFTGQGAQWAGMARELLVYRTFKNSLQASDRYLQSLGSKWSLQQELIQDSAVSRINEPEISQPATTAVQIALVMLLRTFNIEPAVVIGHSSGEIAAAYCSGALSMEEALMIAFFRGVCATRLLEIQRFPGAMMAVSLEPDSVLKYINSTFSSVGQKDRPQVACINSTKNVTISGRADHIETMRESFRSAGILCHKLKISLAYHSFAMQDIAELYHSLISTLSPRKHKRSPVVMVSTVTGEAVGAEALRNPSYWVQNLTMPVQFAQAITSLISNTGSQYLNKKIDGSHRYKVPVNIILEIGPHSALQGAIKDMLRGTHANQGLSYLSVMTRGRDARDTLMQAVGSLYGHGCNLDLDAVNNLGGLDIREFHVLADLPEYPFTHDTAYWRENRMSQRFRLHGSPKLDLLGKQMEDFNDLEPCWRNHIRIREMPWVVDHNVGGSIIYPAAGMIVMAVEAMNQLHSDLPQKILGFYLKDIEITRAMKVSESDDGLETNLTLRKVRGQAASHDQVWFEFRLSSYSHNTWTEHCTGLIALDVQKGQNEVDNNAYALRRCTEHFSMVDTICDVDLNHEEIYDQFSSMGLAFGSTFKVIENGRVCNSGHSKTSVRIFRWPQEQFPQPHIVHPTTLDGVLQSGVVAWYQQCETKLKESLVVPSQIRSMYIASEGLACLHGAKNIQVSATVTDGDTGSGKRLKGFAMNSDCDKLLVSYDGLLPKSSRASQFKHKADFDLSKQICYWLEPVIDVEKLDREQLKALCIPTSDRNEHSPVELFRDFDYVLIKFLRDTVAGLHNNRDAGRHLQPHLQMYLALAIKDLAAVDKRSHVQYRPEWESLMRNQAYFDEACNRISTTGQGKAFVATGRGLSAILRGEQEPLAFLFKDNMMTDFYSDINDRVCFEHWSRYLQILAKARPSLRILEIGAGTGGTAEKILQCLCSISPNSGLYSLYEYTDISAAFFEKANERFRVFPRVSFRTLNIESDPAAQGFELHSYDLIIAANVLHATSHISTTLKHVHSLLKRGGKLMMYEAIRPDIVRTSFLAGLMKGWWAAEDGLRVDGPLMNVKQWDEVLQSQNFSGIELQLNDFEDPECQEFAILMSKALAPNELTHNRPLTTRFIVDDEKQDQDQIMLMKKITTVLRQRCMNLTVETATLRDCSTQTGTETTVLVMLQNLVEFSFDDMKSLSYMQVHQILSSYKRVLWIDKGASSDLAATGHSMSQGLFRCLRNENIGQRILSIFLQTSEDCLSQLNDRQIKQLVDGILDLDQDYQEGLDWEYTELNGALTVPRLFKDTCLTDMIYQSDHLRKGSVSELESTGPVELAIEAIGILESLHWIRDTAYRLPLEEGMVEIEVQAVGLNHKDCLMALGRLPLGVGIGLESAGLITRVGSDSDFKVGDRVISWSPGALRSLLRSKTDFCCKIPPGIPMEEAATLPVVFATAWQTITEIARLQKGETILIHSGASGTGQALIQVAQLIGAEVYVTVSSQIKKGLVMQEYCIPDDHIFYSRDVSFVDGILAATQGKGVDVIINTLHGEGLVASWSCIAAFGRFVEIGKRDILSNSQLPMLNFDKGASFVHYDGQMWQKQSPQRYQEAMQSILDRIETGQLRHVVPLRTYAIKDIGDALRDLQSATAGGKIVIQFNPASRISSSMDQPEAPNTLFDPRCTYLIAGGAGGIGRTIARWMVDQGAQHLVLLGRSGATRPAAAELLKELEDAGVHVKALCCDLINPQEVEATFSEIQTTMPQVKGCVQASMVLRDNKFSDMTYDEWRPVVECKALGTKNMMDCLSKTGVFQDLDFFIMLSSLTSILGLSGQSNYAAGNSYLDNLARSLVSQGIRAVSINLGVMVDDGLLVETEGLLDRVLSTQGMSPITREEFLKMLQHYCDPQQKISSPSEAQVIIGLNGISTSESFVAKSFLDNPMASHIALERLVEVNAGSVEQQAQVNWSDRLVHASGLSQARDIVNSALLSRLKTTYHIEVEEEIVNLDVPFHKLGIDSLLALELCSWIHKELGAELAVFDILGSATIGSVSAMIANRSRHLRQKDQGH